MPQNREIANLDIKETPEQAANNILKAKENNVTPDGYASLKKEFESAPSKPIVTSDPVADSLSQSTQHQAVMKDDIDNLNWLEKQIRFAGKTLQGKDISRELFDLSRRRALGEELSAEEDFRILELNTELQELNGGKAEYNYSFAESVPAEVLGGVYDFAQMLGSSYDLVLQGTGVGALGGGAIGLASMNPIGLAAGTIAGAQIGATTGIGVGFFRDAFRQTTGQIYNDLEFVIPEAKDIPTETKRRLAVGGGLVSGIIGLLPAEKILKNTPFLKKIATPRAFMKYAMTAEGSAMKRLLMQMASTGVAEGTEEGLQEFVQIATENFAKTWDGTELDFINGLTNSFNLESAERVGQAGFIGSLVGGTIQGGLNVATGPLAQAPEQQAPVPLRSDATQEAVQVPTNVKGVKAIQLKMALDQSVKISQDTNTKQMLPEEMDKIRQKMYEDAGTAAIFVDKEELTAWASDDQKAAQAREMIGPEGIAASEINAPIRIETHKFLKIAEDHPDITNLVKADPTGPSVMGFIMELEQAKARREEIMSSMPGETQQTNLVGMKESFVKQEQRVNTKIAEIEKEQKKLENQILADEVTTEAVSEKRLQLDTERNNLIEKKNELISRISGLEDIELRDQRIRDEDITGEESFLAQQTFTKDMEDVLPAKEIMKLNEAETAARTELVDAIDADKAKETERITQLNERYQQLLQQETERGENQTPEKVSMVEQFLDNSRTVGELTPEQQKRANKGLPIHSINPNALSDRLKAKYLDDPLLKSRKVFDKAGIEPELAAQYYNAESVEQFLETMSKTLTNEEMVSTELNEIQAEIEDEVRSNEDLENSRVAKGYDNISRLHLKTGKILRDKYWPRFRKGIARITLDIPKLEKQIQKRAKETIGATPIKNLNINQNVVASRRSQKRATEAYLNGKLEEGFRQKQNAAYSNQLVKETRLANAKVNRAMKFISRLSTPRYQAELKQAGKTYTDAVNYYTDVFNFGGNKKQQAEADKLKKYIESLRDRGEVDQELTPEQMAWLDPKESADQMTVDQILFVEAKLRNVMKQARMKNKLHRNDDTRTIEMIVDEMHEIALTNPKYDETNVERPVGIVPMGYRMKNVFMDGMESLMTNNQFLIQELDQGVLNGPYAKLLHFPLTGAGQYEGPTGMVANAKLLGEYSKRFEKSVKKHYGSLKTFKQMSVDIRTIPELQNTTGFRKAKGRVSKDQLLMILANMGNGENRTYIENYGVDADTMMNVLQRELTEKDFDFVQEAMWNSFKTLAPRINSVHKNTTGTDLDFVKQESFQAFGKTYDGGYFPILLDRQASDLEVGERALAELKDTFSFEEKSANFNSPAYDGIVRSPHTKNRKGSQYTLTLDIGRFSKALDDVIYDITMREPMRDVMTLMNDKQFKNDIISQIGRTKYTTMLNNIVAMTKSASANNIQLHSKLQDTLSGFFGGIESAFAVNYISFNVGSVLMSSLAIPQVQLKMGSKNFLKYMGQTALKMGGSAAKFDTEMFKQTYEMAAEIDPSLQLYRQGIEDYRVSALDKMLPKKRLVETKTYDSLKQAQEAAIEFSFGGILGGLDTMMKMMTTVSVYNMYLNGDAPGHNYDSVHSGKTEEEIHREAKAFTSQFLENTTMRASQYDKTALQKIPMGRSLTRFWNEARNQMNNAIAEGRNISRDSQKMVDAVKGGDYLKANLAFHDAGGRMMNLFAVMMTSQVLMNIARHQVPFIMPDDEENPNEKEFSFEEQLKLMPKFIGYGIANPGETLTNYIGSSTPILRDILFSSSTADMSAIPRRSVSIPLMAAQTDLATAGNVTSNVLQEVMDGATLLEAIEDLSIQEKRGFLNTVGYVVGGIPGLNQALKWWDKIQEEGVDLSFVNKDFLKNVGEPKTFSEEDFNALLEQTEKGKTFNQALKEDMETLAGQLNPLPEGASLNDKGYDIIKHAESEGKWNSRSDDGFGFYNFTEEKWKRIMATPEGRSAGLTLNGRFQKDPKQQETAMRISTKYNVAEMRKKQVPINLESIYFAHHFGPELAADVYTKDDKSKLPTVLKANPELKAEKVKTVGDMKKYIIRALKRGEKSLTNQANRTRI